MNKDVYIVIGNTDNKLSKKEWSQYQVEFKYVVESLAEKVWGIWYSSPDSFYQNMCVGILLAEENALALRDRLEKLCVKYNQDSIALSTAKTEFVSST